MTEDFRGKGAFNVNGQFATSVRYEASVEQTRVVDVQLRFANGRTEIASARVGAEQARELLGEKNFGAIEKTARKATLAEQDRPPGPVRGELRGRSLEYREVMLPAHPAASTENAIHLDSRVRVAPPEQDAPALQEHADRHTMDDEAKALDGRPDPSRTADPDEQARLRRLQAASVPQAVAERFLKVEDKYYFADRTLAFIDQGTKLEAASSNVEVVRSLIAIAEARGWQALSVTGTEDFRRQVWREAVLRGIDVRGYEPSELEREELQRAAQKRHEPNEVTREAPRRVPIEPDREDSPPAASRSGDAATPDQRRQHGLHQHPAGRDELRAGVATGVLLEHGAAPYRFEADNDPSYYVRLQTDRGEQTLWGVDLKRALAESRSAVRTGDEVGVENLGNRPETITVRRRDVNGREVVEEVDTHRNAWSVEKKDYLQQQAAKADAVRCSDREPRSELLKKHPDLVDAAVNLWLGEQVARQKIERPHDQERFVAAVRERLAQAIERGEPVHAPKLRQEVAARLDADRAKARPARRHAAPVSPGSDERMEADRMAARTADRTTRPPRARTPEVPQHAR